MKKKLAIVGLLLVFLLTGCRKNLDESQKVATEPLLNETIASAVTEEVATADNSEIVETESDKEDAAEEAVTQPGSETEYEEPNSTEAPSATQTPASQQQHPDLSGETPED